MATHKVMSERKRIKRHVQRVGKTKASLLWLGWAIVDVLEATSMAVVEKTQKYRVRATRGR